MSQKGKIYRCDAICLLIGNDPERLTWANVLQPNETYDLIRWGGVSYDGGKLIVGGPNLSENVKIIQEPILEAWAGWDDLPRWEDSDPRPVEWFTGSPTWPLGYEIPK